MSALNCPDHICRVEIEFQIRVIAWWLGRSLSGLMTVLCDQPQQGRDIVTEVTTDAGDRSGFKGLPGVGGVRDFGTKGVCWLGSLC